MRTRNFCTDHLIFLIGFRSRQCLSLFPSEDSKFFNHKGIDLGEIKKSVELNLKEKRIVRGASTITQQLVKMAFLSHKKSFIRKFREIIGSIALEKLMTKERIAELYLNNINFGKGVIGVKQAAQRFANTTPELLTLEDSIQLALVLPRPEDRSNAFLEQSLSKFGAKRYKMIAQRMYDKGVITSLQLERTLKMGDYGSPLEE